MYFIFPLHFPYMMGFLAFIKNSLTNFIHTIQTLTAPL